MTPLVESVNALPLETFIDRYVPCHIHNRAISVPCSRSDTPESQNTSNDSEQQYEDYSIDIHSAASIPDRAFEACFALIKLTSSDAYKRSTTGWSPRRKKNEMKLTNMRYLVLTRKRTGAHGMETPGNLPGEKDDDLGGFASFMTTYEDGLPVVYCYELHLAPKLQHKGLGKKLVGMFEEIGRNIGLDKAMLTVFKSNKAAMKFYERIGYVEDEFSPRPVKLRNGRVKDFDYMILSKSLRNGNGQHGQDPNMGVLW